MKKADVKIGSTYVVKVSGWLQNVQIKDESPFGGWYGVNTSTGRTIQIKTAGRLRGLAQGRGGTP